MRKLHLVGLTTDRDGLIFTARKGSKSGGYIVPLDDKVLAAIAEARNGSPVAEVDAVEVEPVPKRLRSQSALTPREMQARLRAGRSIEEVAAEAGVDTEWVARFAVPILAEQAQVVELARALVYAKPRLGESAQPLGPSVVQNLSDRGVFLPDDLADAAWSAFQLHDSVWMVRFHYRSRGRDQEAQWEIDVPTGRLLARNRQASDLGYVDPGGRRRMDVDDDVAEEEPVVAPVRRAGRGAAKAEPMAQAVAKAKRLTAARAPATRERPGVRRSPAAPARPAPKAAKVAKPARAAPKAAKVGRPAPKAAKVGRISVPAAAKAAPKAATAKSATRRRPTKAVPAPEAGPTAGSGSVRMAVAQVSTARVAASMATADRAPWAAAVRRAPRPAPRPAPGNTGDGAAPRRPGSRSVPYELDRPERREAPEAVPPFKPRPLPGPGAEPPRIRRVNVARPALPQDGPPAVSLPAPRRQPPRQEPMPAERPKRRRLRPR